MVQSQGHHHRPTLKQQNKGFKSRHATKSALKDIAKGKVPKPSNKSRKSQANAPSRADRRNTAKQAQSAKVDARKKNIKLFNGPNGVPRIVAVIPLSADVSAEQIVGTFAQSLDVAYSGGRATIPADRFKTSLHFVPVPYGDTYGALDAASVADYVVFGLSAAVEVDHRGDTLLRILQARGLPEVVSVSPNLRSEKDIMKSLLSFIQYFVPTQTRIFDLGVASDVLNANRALSEGLPKDVRWREGRSYMLPEGAIWEQGILKITGIIRGAALSADRLIHLPNWGDYQIDKIYASPLPRGKQKSGNVTVMDVEGIKTLLAEPDHEEADSLVSRNEPDDTQNEQTWPTEEEMASAPANATDDETVLRRRRPKGMNEYQAGWIPDDEDLTDEEYEDEVYHDAIEYTSEPGAEDVPEIEMEDEDVEMELSSRRSGVHFEDLPDEEEEDQLQSWLKRSRHEEEKDEMQFPDEIDTPKDIPARTRFQRYRGLRSFRTSPWDPYENLPVDYSTIFQFEDFKRTERGLLRSANSGAPNSVEEGVRIELWLKDAPQEALKEFTSASYAIFALIKHEHKKSVLNFTIQRNTEYTESVKSKDALILCVGPRRLRVNPVYSQFTRGGGKGSNNVHKFERFLKHGHTSIGTIYGPITFGRLACILLRDTDSPSSSGPELVGMGTFVDADTTRIVAKRIILSGHPFKVHKKTATVRYMFFNADDVAYFKPIQLHTKFGRIGHIRESLGTHGYLKAHFDGPIGQMDTVLMSLYKRVYPKWSSLYTPFSSSSSDEVMQE